MADEIVTTQPDLANSQPRVIAIKSPLAQTAFTLTKPEHFVPVNLFTRWPRVSVALAYVALPTLLALVGAVGTLMTGVSENWGVALRRQALYWASWGILSPLIFRLCRWLHDGKQGWLRYVLGMLAGACLATIFFPLLYELFQTGFGLIAWKYSGVKAPPSAFWPEYRQIFRHLFEAAVFLFACTVIVWYAVTNYREAQDRRLESVELGAMLQQAQLQTLRSQLNPHFLFNTLHSIAELIHENPRRAEQMVLQLGELLRKALKTQALDVPLREEIDFIRSYLDIEQTRLGDRLEIVWNIDPVVLDARVPSLILQPIVENAIQHGITASSRGGRLEIAASRSNGQLQLEVRDSGPGLSLDGDKSNGGIGLSIARARLERLYGPRASFRLTNDSGLIVSILLPWQA